MPGMRKTVLCGLVPLLLLGLALGDDVYRKPPREILDVLNAPPTPEAVVSPSGTDVLLIERILYPPISDLAQPMLRLAGVRINPKNNGPHNAFLYRSATLRHLDGAQWGDQDCAASGRGNQHAFLESGRETVCVHQYGR